MNSEILFGSVLYFVIVIISGIFQVILFFKIWDMTNNVSKIKSLLENYSLNKTTDNNAYIGVGDYVMEIKTRKEFKVIRIIAPNVFECMERYGSCVFYTFNRNEIIRINK